MYAQFSLVRFSSVALTTTSSKALVWARNMVGAVKAGRQVQLKVTIGNGAEKYSRGGIAKGVL